MNRADRRRHDRSDKKFKPRKDHNPITVAYPQKKLGEDATIEDSLKAN